MNLFSTVKLSLIMKKIHIRADNTKTIQFNLRFSVGHTSNFGRFSKLKYWPNLKIKICRLDAWRKDQEDLSMPLLTTD